MTDGDMTGGRSWVLRTDRAGRVRRTAEQRAAILVEFDRSGLSGPQFARVSGISYQTLATWLKKRRERTLVPVGRPNGGMPLFVPAVGASLPGSAAGLELTLPGGASAMIESPHQAQLAAVLVRELNGARRC